MSSYRKSKVSICKSCSHCIRSKSINLANLGFGFTSVKHRDLDQEGLIKFQQGSGF